MNKLKAPSIKHVYVNEKGEATIICESCGKSKKIFNVTPSLKLKPVPVNCTCGHRFIVTFDSRRYYRKQVSLKGTFEIPENEKKYPMIVENISLGGVLIRTPYANLLEKGQVIKVEFQLDDPNHSLISRPAIVRHVSTDKAGLEFVQDRAYDKILGFYLLN